MVRVRVRVRAMVRVRVRVRQYLLERDRWHDALLEGLVTLETPGT